MQCNGPCLIWMYAWPTVLLGKLQPHKRVNVMFAHQLYSVCCPAICSSTDMLMS